MKRILAFGLILSLLLFMPIATALETSRAGDVNKDGSLSAGDALLVLQYTVRLREFSGEELSRGDVNASGEADAADALLILQRTVGLPVVFLSAPMASSGVFPYYSAGGEVGVLERRLENTLWAYRGSLQNYLDYRSLLENMGYRMVQQTDVSGNLSASYQSSSEWLVVTYSPADATIRIARDAISTLDWMEDPWRLDRTGITLTQLVPDYSSGWGNIYILTLADGRFVIFDGGMNATGQDHENIYQYLKAKNTRPDGIVIAAWILTHEDGDHYGGLHGFALVHGGDVTLERFLFNPSPAANYLGYSFWEDIKCYDNPDVVVLHTGQTFSLGGVGFEVLYTAENWFPKLGNSSNENNDASLVVRLTVEGQTVLMTGDIMKLASDLMVRMYGSNLKSDIVQASHHGCYDTPESTASAEFYRLVDPRVSLWPCTVGNFQSWWQGESNFQLLFRQNVQETMVADTTIKELPLPYGGLADLKQWQIDWDGTLCPVYQEYNEILGWNYTKVYTPSTLPPG